MEVHIEFMDGSVLTKDRVWAHNVEPYTLTLIQNFGEGDHSETYPLVNIKRWRTEH